jgi:hypothetical protein
LNVLLRQTDRGETPLDLSAAVATFDSPEQIFVCRKAIGYFFLRPRVAGSVLVSVLRVCDDQTADIVRALLSDPLLVNYGRTIVDYLRNIEVADPAYQHIQLALKSAEQYLEELGSAGLIKELHPSERERQLEHLCFADQTREAHKQAMEQSVLLSLVHRSVILYGKRSLTYFGTSNGERRPVEMELTPHSVSMELPRMDVFDPVGLDYLLRVFRVESL